MAAFSLSCPISPAGSIENVCWPTGSSESLPLPISSALRFWLLHVSGLTFPIWEQRAELCLPYQTGGPPKGSAESPPSEWRSPKVGLGLPHQTGGLLRAGLGPVPSHRCPKLGPRAQLLAESEPAQAASRESWEGTGPGVGTMQGCLGRGCRGPSSFFLTNVLRPRSAGDLKSPGEPALPSHLPRRRPRR